MQAAELINDVDDPTVDTFFAFWQDARGTNRFPGQRDLTLPSVAGLLPNVFMMDVVEPGTFGYRFVGTKIDEHLGISLTGKVLEDFRSGRTLKELAVFFSTISQDGVAGVMSTRLPSERFEWVRYTRIGLPVADDHVTINKILGLFLFEPAISENTGLLTIGDVKNDEWGEVVSRYGSV